MSPFRIEICGGMASGKTTFANLFSDAGRLALEDFQSVPFWQAFFDRPGSYNFETELSFLLQHYHQVKRAAIESDNPGLVFCDFSFTLDRAYAAVSLGGTKRQLFEAVLHDILSEIEPPQLIIHLKCSPATELRRVQTRQRSAEATATRDFLVSLNSAVDAEVAGLPKSAAVVRFNSDAQDFASDLDTKRHCRSRVLKAISALSPGTFGS